MNLEGAALNKSESKYFNTAERMDVAFLELLDEKDLSYITVKEICSRAGVNRSTFYLHYETIEDLLSECLEYMKRQFMTYMEGAPQDFPARIGTTSLDELYLVTPEYLVPYLTYVKDNRHIYRVALENSSALRTNNSYARLFENVFSPILERYGVSGVVREYMMEFYINGLVAIVRKWICGDCEEPIEHIVSLIRLCAPRPRR